MSKPVTDTDKIHSEYACLKPTIDTVKEISAPPPPIREIWPETDTDKQASGPPYMDHGYGGL